MMKTSASGKIPVIRRSYRPKSPSADRYTGLTTKRKYLTNYAHVFPFSQPTTVDIEHDQAFVVKISGKGRKSHLVAIVKGKALFSALASDIAQFTLECLTHRMLARPVPGFCSMILL
jgi:hypothetical protein